MTKDLAQINVTLEEITFHTNILFTLAKFQVSISELRHRVNVIRDAIFGLQMNLDILYHHFSAMVNNKLSPEMISPRNLLKILSNIQDDIQDHPKLSLPEELMINLVYKYYKMVQFELTMNEEVMLGVLQVPLIEKNKHFRLYKIYNLPLPLSEANLQVQYNLTHKYLAITNGDQYVAFPSEEEIMGCQLTASAFCELNKAIFPTIGLESCEFALYQQNHQQIHTCCNVKTTPFKNDYAVSLEPNYWLIASKKQIVLHINCLRDTTYLEIKSPIDVIHLEDGCEATSASLVLPGHSHLVKEDNYLTKTHTVAFKLKYTPFKTLI